MKVKFHNPFLLQYGANQEILRGNKKRRSICRNDLLCSEGPA
jgi:hypothetical protein